MDAGSDTATSLSVSELSTKPKPRGIITEGNTSRPHPQPFLLPICLLASARQGGHTDAGRRGREQEGFCPHGVWAPGGAWETEGSTG